MKSLCVAVITFLSVASLSSAEEAQAVKVTRIGTQPSAEGPAKNFIGIVRIDSRFQGPSPARIGDATVILRAAFGAHRRGEFELSVPVFLAQSDGVCLDLTGYHFFMRDRATQKPKSSVYVAARVGNEVSSAMLSPLTCVLPINAATKEREKTLQDKGVDGLAGTQPAYGSSWRVLGLRNSGQQSKSNLADQLFCGRATRTFLKQDSPISFVRDRQLWVALQALKESALTVWYGSNKAGQGLFT